MQKSRVRMHDTYNQKDTKRVGVNIMCMACVRVCITLHTTTTYLISTDNTGQGRQILSTVEAETINY